MIQISLPSHGREWGDFQTPSSLTDRVCSYLASSGIAPRVVIEPTCGEGHFILSALKYFPTVELVYGVEIQPPYITHLKQRLIAANTSAQIELHAGDIFTHRFPDAILQAQDILIIGNPPWVTNSELGNLESANLPTKKNLKGLNGIDAVTGKSNFDLGEYVLLRMLELFSSHRGTLAMLCKNSVVKNLLEFLPLRQFRVSNIRTLEIDAQREFGAAVDASLLVMDLGTPSSASTCRVASLDCPENIFREFGWTHNKFVSDIHAYEVTAEFDGVSPFVWRQGVKHDCSHVMELSVQPEGLLNGDSEVVDVEDEQVFWLLKSSDLRQFEVATARKKVIVTQFHPSEDTAGLQRSAPKLWKYLTNHKADFTRRKSSIYRNRSRFAIFGIGDYSFKSYKVAISGLYKEPQFSLVLPIDNRPVMLDDTCYFLSFGSYLDALFTASILNSSVVKSFLQSVVFRDAKRPYTKVALMRIDLLRVASRLTFDALHAFWNHVGYTPQAHVTASDFSEYTQHLNSSSEKRLEMQLTLDMV